MSSLSDIPSGALYYPYCGHDTYEPLLYFANNINDFYFSDRNMPKIPTPSCDIQNDMIRANNLYTNKTIPGIKEASHKAKRNIIIDTNELGPNFNVGNIYLPHHQVTHTWIHDNNKTTNIFVNEMDGALTLLLKIKKLAVFFYRRDSQGEGGSGQWWFGPELFNLVVKKLVYGGYIITDGSNFDPSNPNVPWRPLGMGAGGNPQNKSFTYNSNYFEYITNLESEVQSVGVWKIYKNNIIDDLNHRYLYNR